MKYSIVVFKGNHYDSRTGSQSYAMWTTGSDYVAIAGDNVVALRTRRYDGDTTISALSEIPDGYQEWSEVPIGSLSKALQDKILLWLKLTTKEEIVQRDREANGIEWCENHLVHSVDITRRLRGQIGEWTEAQFVRRISRCAGTGYANFIYEVDGKWQVKVMANLGGGRDAFYDEIEVKDLASIKNAQRDFGQRCAGLAKAAGVPWKIAVFAGKVADDDEAVRLLKVVKAAKGKADESLQWELSCGIDRRKAAIRQLIGETFDSLNCSGQRATSTLAEYLAVV